MSAAAAPRNPFPGLRPFEPKDSTLFFGRDEQIGEALDRLLRQRMLVVVGVSGCGKSSLVGAGMVPALEMGLAGDSGQRWQVSTMRPGDGPLGELARCLGFGGGPLAQRTYGLSEAVETHLPAGDNLLLVVDQFEEIFPFRDRKLRESAGSEADLFVSYLLRASQDPAKRVYIVLTMRSDYLGECAKFHGLPEASNDGQYLVPRMTRRQLQEAIEGPLAAAGVEIHPPLVQDLLNQCDEEPDNLPLLQHLLRRIFEKWEEDGGQGSITAAMAEKVGGLAEALNLDAEAVYGKLAPEEQRAAEVLLRRITESRHTDRDGDDQPIRRPQRAEDLARLARVPEAVLGGIVRRFEERGLLVVRRTDEGDKIDLPHECLCLKWKRLKDWVRSEAEDAKKLRFIHDAVGKSYLTGLALAEALEWRNAGRLDSEWCLRYLIGEQRTGVVAWVEESERLVKEAAERDRRQQEKEIQQAKERSRRALRTAAFLGVAFLVVAAFGLYADYQRREAISARDVAETAKKQADVFEGCRQHREYRALLESCACSKGIFWPVRTWTVPRICARIQAGLRMHWPTQRSRYLPVWNSRNLIDAGEAPHAAFLDLSAVPETLRNDNDLILLGRFGDINVFAFEIESTEPPQLQTGTRFEDLRLVASVLPADGSRPLGLCARHGAVASAGIASAAPAAPRRSPPAAAMCSSARIPRAGTNNFRARIRPSSFWSATASARCWDDKPHGPSAAIRRSPALSNPENRSRTRSPARCSRRPASKSTRSSITPRSPGPSRPR